MKRLTLISTAVLIAAVIVPSAATASPHRVKLKVGAQTVEWLSPKSYGPADPVTIMVLFKGRELRGRVARANCTLDFAGFGLVARVYGCDGGKRPAPIRVRLASARSDVAKVTIVYDDDPPPSP